MSWKKMIIIVGIFLVVLGLPAFLISNPMMDVWQDKIDGNPQTDFNKWLQISTAGICYKTMRPERAAEGYKRFIERYPEDARYAFALIRYAQSLEESKRYDEALDHYELFLNSYPGHEDAKLAEDGVRRIKYIIPK